mmetsp:Transcript_15471/g.27707  ORF Transcript_15471/g.27707 Transcript_15471/m.27707 type:complete len:355 (-) Transcript_15471:172-1236(-)
MEVNQGLCIELLDLSSVRTGRYRFGDFAMAILGRQPRPYVRIQHGQLTQDSHVVQAINGRASLNMGVVISYPLRADSLLLRVFDKRGILANLFGAFEDPLIGEGSLKLSDLDLSKTQEHMLLLRRDGYIQAEVKVRIKVEPKDHVMDGGDYDVCYDFRKCLEAEEGYMQEAPVIYKYGNSPKAGTDFYGVVERYDLALPGSNYVSTSPYRAPDGYDLAPQGGGATPIAGSGYDYFAVSKCQYNDTSPKAIVDKYDLATQYHGDHWYNAAPARAGQEYGYSGKAKADDYTLGAPKAAASPYDVSKVCIGDSPVAAAHEYNYHLPQAAGQDYQGVALRAGSDNYNYVVPLAVKGNR